MTIHIQTLTTLNLTENDIGIEGGRYLANALQNNTVSYIFLSICCISAMTIDTQTLTTVDLGHNYIRNEGARCLVNALQNNTVSDIFYPFAAFSQ